MSDMRLIDADKLILYLNDYALQESPSMQKKSIADMCNVPEEKVIPISRLEYETYTDE